MIMTLRYPCLWAAVGHGQFLSGLLPRPMRSLGLLVSGMHWACEGNVLPTLAVSALAFCQVGFAHVVEPAPLWPSTQM